MTGCAVVADGIRVRKASVASRTVTSSLRQPRPQDRYFDRLLNRHLRRAASPGIGKVQGRVQGSHSRDESLLHACLQWLSRSCDSYPWPRVSVSPFLLSRLRHPPLRLQPLLTCTCVHIYTLYTYIFLPHISPAIPLLAIPPPVPPFPIPRRFSLRSSGRNLVRL